MSERKIGPKEAGLKALREMNLQRLARDKRVEKAKALIDKTVKVTGKKRRSGRGR
jgi:hypothetical protein